MCDAITCQTRLNNSNNDAYLKKAERFSNALGFTTGIAYAISSELIFCATLITSISVPALKAALVTVDKCIYGKFLTALSIYCGGAAGLYQGYSLGRSVKDLTHKLMTRQDSSESMSRLIKNHLFSKRVTSNQGLSVLSACLGTAFLSKLAYDLTMPLYGEERWVNLAHSIEGYLIGSSKGFAERAFNVYLPLYMINSFYPLKHSIESSLKYFFPQNCVKA